MDLEEYQKEWAELSTEYKNLEVITSHINGGI